jgi:hypothetical protein
MFMKKISYKTLTAVPSRKGFAMLFTILLISLVLAMALGISNITFKQTILSSLAKDSQIAFYQADAGADCGLYYDFTLGSFPQGSTVSTVPATLTCGNDTLSLNTSESQTTGPSGDYFIYYFNGAGGSSSCYNIVFDKRASEKLIQSYGYNVCATSSPRQVERALEVKY